MGDLPHWPDVLCISSCQHANMVLHMLPRPHTGLSAGRNLALAAAQPSGRGNRNARSKNTDSPSTSSRQQVQQTQSQVKSQTSSTARQAEAQVDSAAETAQDAAQDTRCACCACTGATLCCYVLPAVE